MDAETLRLDRAAEMERLLDSILYGSRDAADADREAAGMNEDDATPQAEAGAP